MSKRQSIDELVMQLNREQCTEILEAYGFQVYNRESVGELREAIATNVKDGETIPLSFVASVAEQR
jgi:hypothetical protein